MSLSRMLVVSAVLTLVGSMSVAGEPANTKQPAPTQKVSIAAVVNGENITESEVASVVQQQLRGRNVSPDVANELHELVLNYLIDGRLVEQFLAGKKIEVDPKEIDAIIQRIRSSVAASGVPFEEALKRQGHTEKSLRERLAGQQRFQKYAESQLTDAKLAEHFAANKTDFDGTEVQASHVLIKVEKDASDADKKAALAKIKAVRTEVLGGLDFAEAAKKYSDCPSSSEGGDLGFFPRRNRMVEPFAAAAFALKTGDLSEPVETQFGLHLIKVTDRKEGGKKLDDVRDELKGALSGELWQEIVTQQRKDAKIETPDSKNTTKTVPE